MTKLGIAAKSMCQGERCTLTSDTCLGSSLVAAGVQTDLTEHWSVFYNQVMFFPLMDNPPRKHQAVSACIRGAKRLSRSMLSLWNMTNDLQDRQHGQDPRLTKNF